MLLRQKPTNPNKYYITKNEESQVLQHNGFIPKYIWNECFYFEKSVELNDFLKVVKN